MSEGVTSQFGTVTGTNEVAVTTVPTILRYISAINEDAIVTDAAGVVKWKQPLDTSQELNLSLAGLTIVGDGVTGEVYVGYEAPA